MEKCQLFLKNCEKFKWFIVKYYGEEYFEELVQLAKDNKWESLCNELENVWFQLPDDKFNIMVNPEGWNEFLEVIEE